jgi:hypothetical protein
VDCFATTSKAAGVLQGCDPIGDPAAFRAAHVRGLRRGLDEAGQRLAALQLSEAARGTAAAAAATPSERPSKVRATGTPSVAVTGQTTLAAGMVLPEAGRHPGEASGRGDDAGAGPADTAAGGRAALGAATARGPEAARKLQRDPRPPRRQGQQQQQQQQPLAIEGPFQAMEIEEVQGQQGGACGRRQRRPRATRPW